MDSLFENAQKLDKILKKIHIFCDKMGRGLGEEVKEKKEKEGELERVRGELRVAKRAVGELEELLKKTQELVVGSMGKESGGYLEKRGEVREEEGEKEEEEEEEEEEEDISSGVAEDESEIGEEGEEEEGREGEGGREREELEKMVVQKLNGIVGSYYSPLSSRKAKLRKNISCVAMRELLGLFEGEEGLSSSSFSFSSSSPEMMKEVCDILLVHNDLQFS